MIEPRKAAEPDYGGVAKALHWLIVALLAAQYIIGWTMPGIRRGVQPEGLVSLHLSLGVLVLLIAVLRLIWRLGHPVPPIRDNVPPWQQAAAKVVHILLYLLLFVLPLTGWMNASSRGWNIDLFGVVTLPQILPTGSPLLRSIGELHTPLSYGLLILVGLHLLAALYHHFWLRDRVLVRMLPFG